MKKLSISILAFAMMGGFALVGCADAEDPGDVEPTEEAAEEADTPPEVDMEDEDASVDRENETAGVETEVEVVAFTNDDGKLLCPVMGNVIETEEDAVGYEDYEGTRYYFCCAGCPEQFAAEPEKFAEGAALDA